MTTTVRRLSQAVSNEYLPIAIVDPVEYAIVQDAPTAWWMNNQATMQGVVSALPYAWQDVMALARATAAVTGINPITSSDSNNNGNPYIQMGYGGSLAQRNFTLAQVQVHVGGSGYAVNDTITDANGSVFKVITAGSGIVGSVSIITIGTYSSFPTSFIQQASTSGSGTGCELTIDFEANNGSLITPTGSTFLTAGQPFSLVSAFRVPTVASGLITGNPGGTLIGNALNQSYLSDVDNTRQTALAIGYGQSTNGGKLVFRINGDIYNLYQSTSQDLRDGQWHVGMCDLVPSTGVATLWLDGHQIATNTFNAGITINSTVGGRQIRLGACGLPSSLPVAGYAGDMGDQMIYPVALSGDTTRRQRVQNYLMQKFGVSGSSS